MPFGFGRMMGGNMGNWPFNEIRFMSRFDDAGSTLGITYQSVKRKHFYALQKENRVTAPDVFYTSPLPTDILEKKDDGTLWMRQALSERDSKDDVLLKYFNKQTELVTMPDGYKAVDRFACTGKNIAGTFGNILSTEPIRSFVKKGNSWKELPVPDGFTFSYVQKIFEDGMILGFVTDANRENMKQVIWDGDKIAILSDSPAWPKSGKYSLVINATRRGDIYVRNVLNTESGSNENYMIHVSRK